VPTSVKTIFDSAGLSLSGPVTWGSAVPATKRGIYVVSVTSDVKDRTGLDNAPLDSGAIREWIEICPKMSVDGQPATVARLRKRLSGFWLPDEPIVYIGKSDPPIRKRVGQFYRTRLGASKPHAGGHWLKTLKNLNDLFVFWAEVGDDSELSPERVEHSVLLPRFVESVSAKTKSHLYDPDHPFPFANLAHPPGTNKVHGLRGTRCL